MRGFITIPKVIRAPTGTVYSGLAKKLSSLFLEFSRSLIVVSRSFLRASWAAFASATSFSLAAKAASAALMTSSAVGAALGLGLGVVCAGSDRARLNWGGSIKVLITKLIIIGLSNLGIFFIFILFILELL